MKILLTGGNGFIGRNIIEKLGKNHVFLSPDHLELDLEKSDDVLDYLKKYPVDCVINAANIGGNRKTINLSGVTNRNLKIFFNLVRAKKYYKKLIFLGSGAEYDKRFDLSKVSEDYFDRSVPVDEYGFYKYVCSKYAENVDFITHLRLFGIYGKYEDFQIRFISQTICRILLNLPVVIKQNVFFDYLYINDFVKILDYFIINKAEKIFYNVGRGQSIDLISIAHRLISLIGTSVEIIVENPGLNKEYTCNTDRLKSEIGRFDYTGLDESLKEMILYYQNILPQLDKNLFLKNL